MGVLSVGEAESGDIDDAAAKEADSVSWWLWTTAKPLISIVSPSDYPRLLELNASVLQINEVDSDFWVIHFVASLSVNFIEMASSSEGPFGRLDPVSVMF